MTLPVALTSEIQKLSPSAIIELFIIDATDLGGDIFRFHAGTNGLTSNVVWNGDTYIRFPVHVSGFEFSGVGQLPRPKLGVSNLFSTITQILLDFNDLQGAKVTRKRTMAKFLDAVNFEGGINATADPTAEFAEDVYFVDRKSLETRDAVEFELSAAIDLAGVAIPRRQIIQNICIWRYRGAECGYAGAPLWDENDEELIAASSTEGQAVIDARIALTTAQAALALAESILAADAAAKGIACDLKFAETQYSYVLGTGTPSYGIVIADDGHGTTTETAYWNSIVVTQGSVYRRGNSRVTGDVVPVAGQAYETTYQVFEIQRWAFDSAGCSAATTIYNSALTSRDSAQTAVDTAESTLDTALSALPPDDALFSLDVCGKRLASCKLRFGASNPLPFGSFPAAGLIR